MPVIEEALRPRWPAALSPGQLPLFKHSGDLGDAVYFMPIMRSILRKAGIASGIIAFEPAQFTRQKLTPQNYAPFVPLAMSQEYVSDVVPWENWMRPLADGNGFRKYLRAGFRTQIALCDLMCDAAGVPRETRDEKWLTVTPTPVANVIFNRTHRYTNPSFPWAKVFEKYGHEAKFIGTDEEYRDFCGAVGTVPYYRTPDLLSAAQVIAGSALFVGNQSCCYAIARGLQHPSVLEVCPALANCLFYKSGPVWHGWNGDVELPDLE